MENKDQYMMDSLDLIREAAKDKSLSDGAFRLLVLSKNDEISKEIEQWYNESIDLIVESMSKRKIG
jgi:hypothetical protein